jgi:hypothetical protein
LDLFPLETQEFSNESAKSIDQVVYDINFMSVGFFFLSLPLLFTNSLLRTVEQDRDNDPSDGESSDSIEDKPESRNVIISI